MVPGTGTMPVVSGGAGLALSTSWNARGRATAREMAEDVARLGFGRMELSYVPPGLLVGLAEALEETGVQVASIHNPLPAPEDAEGKAMAPSAVEWLASPDAALWRRAVDAAKHTIALAAELGAKGVVVHFGKVDVPSRQRELMTLIRERGREDAAFVALREEAWAARQAAAPRHLERAVEAALRLGEAARAMGVWVGAETRDGYHEVPSAEEFEVLLGATQRAGLPVGYWHDCGHAAKQELLGYQARGQLLRRWGSETVGIHLHDCADGRDHLAPGAGEVDFGFVAETLRAGALRTLELGPGISENGVRDGREVLKKFGLGD